MARPPKPAGRPSSVRGKSGQQQTSTVGKKKRIPIDKLLDYWDDISKRPTLTLEDFLWFFERVEATMEYFREYYAFSSMPEFLRRMNYIWSYRDGMLRFATKTVTQGNQLSNRDYSEIRDAAKKFIPLIKKCFSRNIAVAINQKPPLQDAETLLASSTKLTYRWAAGIIASNHIATILIQLSRFRSGEKIQKDDIITLKDNLKNRTKNRKFKTFLVRSHRRFEDADKVRNRCAHVIEGEPTKQEIEQSIALARLLQKYMPRR